MSFFGYCCFLKYFLFAFLISFLLFFLQCLALLNALFSTKPSLYSKYSRNYFISSDIFTKFSRISNSAEFVTYGQNVLEFCKKLIFNMLLHKIHYFEVFLKISNSRKVDFVHFLVNNNLC